jgi:hypothetical protein
MEHSANAASSVQHTQLQKVGRQTALLADKASDISAAELQLLSCGARVHDTILTTCFRATDFKKKSNYHPVS